VRSGLAALIGAERDMAVVGEASDGAETVAMVRALRPDVAIIDLSMPRKDGLAAIAEIRDEGIATRMLVLTSRRDASSVLAAIQAGALGYLVKDASPPELLQGIRDAARGTAALSPDIARLLVIEMGRRDPAETDSTELSAREIEVLKAHRTRPQQRKHQAARSEFPCAPVGRHVSNILDKLHLYNRTQAALYALRPRAREPRWVVLRTRPLGSSALLNCPRSK
jgi:DNA-binding NarL/FixJ family response regulator